MFRLIKNLFSKNNIKIISTDVKPQYDNKKTLSQINGNIQALEKRLTFIERVTWIEKPESQNLTLDERFNKKIKQYSEKDQDLLKLWIDKEMIIHNKEIRLKDMPWHNPNCEMSIREQNKWKTLRFLYLFWALEKLFKFRRDNFTVIDGGLKDGR